MREGEPGGGGGGRRGRPPPPPPLSAWRTRWTRSPASCPVWRGGRSSTCPGKAPRYGTPPCYLSAGKPIDAPTSSSPKLILIYLIYTFFFSSRCHLIQNRERYLRRYRNHGQSKYLLDIFLWKNGVRFPCTAHIHRR